MSAFSAMGKPEVVKPIQCMERKKMYHTKQGLVYLALEDIFTYIENCSEREYLLRLSMVEIYNEHLQDLLSNNAKPIHIQENKVQTSAERED
jgi:hypothetical protein